MFVRLVKIRQYERGLVFRNREFVGILRPGWRVVWGLWPRLRIDRVSVRDPWLAHPELDVIVKSQALGTEAMVIDLGDAERAVVTVDGRVEAILRPGQYALWTVFRDVEAKVIDARSALFEGDNLSAVLGARGAREALEAVAIEPGSVGVFIREGRVVSTLPAGTQALWKGVARARIVEVDLREQILDVAGQDVMTADKVTLRLNTVVAFRVSDPVAVISRVEDFRQALYREAQLALRAVIGTRELDVLLSDKDAVAQELDRIVRARVAELGVEVVTLGIRDVILPGEMRDLMNKVTEAKKAAEANFIMRREETAAMRSQANTARILQSSPTLMRLRELEVIEKVAAKGTLNVVVGEKGLADRVVTLL